MSTMSTALVATCLALASFCATAQTGAPPATGAPPTHPATGGSDATASPTTPPTHPAVGTSGATPEAAAAGKQNPSVNGYKESNAPRDDAKRANARTTSKPAPGSSAERNPTSTDSMAKDNMPKHPAAGTK
jgi:hypothetical protein